MYNEKSGNIGGLVNDVLPFVLSSPALFNLFYNGNIFAYYLCN